MAAKKIGTKSVLTKEVKEAIETANRRVLNKALYRLYLAKVNPDYKIGDREAHEQWYQFISGVIDGSISIKELESAPDKKAKSEKKSSAKSSKSTAKSSKSTTKTTKNTKTTATATSNSDNDKIRVMLMADYMAGKITAKQFADAIIAI